MSMKLETEIEDMVTRTVRETRTSGRLHVPKGWIGKRVIVCVLTDQSEMAQ